MLQVAQRCSPAPDFLGIWTRPTLSSAAATRAGKDSVLLSQHQEFKATGANRLKNKFFFSVSLFRAKALAYKGSQARALIRATAASLHHSHSNTKSEPRLQPQDRGGPTAMTLMGTGLRLCEGPKPASAPPNQT